MFNVGDVVKCIGVQDGNKKTLGEVGKVIDVRGGNSIFGVEFSRDVRGHTCRNKGRDGYCWDFREEKLRLFKTFSDFEIEE
jgi:hypothetical protein